MKGNDLSLQLHACNHMKAILSEDEKDLSLDQFIQKHKNVKPSQDEKDEIQRQVDQLYANMSNKEFKSVSAIGDLILVGEA